MLKPGEIINAISLVSQPASPAEVLSFPIRIEEYHDFSLFNPLARTAIHITLLDQDLQQSGFDTRSGEIQDGIWELDEPLEVSKDTGRIRAGYFLMSLPGDPLIINIDTDGKADPRSIY